MAHGRRMFALVGYSEDLEKRPVKFVDPIPSSRICSACGNIPKTTYTPMCGHTFCDSCCENCTTASECVCPLDGDVCDRVDATRKEYKAEQLLRRKVHCWNEVNGCRVVLPASHVTEHVRHDCRHHVTRCPKCSGTVLSRDVCAHLKSQCSGLVLHAASETQQDADSHEGTQLVAFERRVDERVRELDAKLSQLSFESGSQSDKITELCHTINHLKEALTEQFAQATATTVARSERNEADMKAKLIDVCNTITHRMTDLPEEIGLTSDRNIEEIKSLYSQKSASLMTAITSVLTSVPNESKTHQWVVKGYAALKGRALKRGASDSISDKVYLRRYRMSWGIDFQNKGGSVDISLLIQLHEGREDEFLDWPFTKELKLSIIHPDTLQELHRFDKPDLSEDGSDCLSRPVGCSSELIMFGKTRVATSELEHEGYVKGDQLLVMLEVLM